MKNKNIFICSFLIILLIFSIVFIYQNNDKKEMKSDTSELISVYLRNRNNNYEKSREISWPIDGYVFNKEKSYCEKDTTIDWVNNKIQLTGNKTDKCYIYFDNIVEDYDYTGTSQEFIAPANGTYKIELWGAQGGDIDKYLGGKGAYTKGEIYLTKGEKLYVYIGGQGDNIVSGGFNGGGAHNDIYGSSGGGATDVRLVNRDFNDFESLKSRIMVAAGGGGANNRNYHVDSNWYGAGNGGYGGALTGGAGESLDETHTNPETGRAYGWAVGYGGTQTDGGKLDCEEYISQGKECNENDTKGKFGFAITAQSGGGSGYYGGAGSYHSGAGGGSSYISGYKGCVAIKQESTENNIQFKDNCTDGTNNIECSYHYSNKIFTETKMIAGNETMPSPNGGTEVGHSGNGYARITYLGK